jgi:hypothetical protein
VKAVVYPVAPPVGDRDPRFTLGLVVEVAEVLARHGFPAFEAGDDLVRLELALYRAIYSPQ